MKIIIEQIQKLHKILLVIKLYIYQYWTADFWILLKPYTSLPLIITAVTIISRWNNGAVVTIRVRLVKIQLHVLIKTKPQPLTFFSKKWIDHIQEKLEFYFAGFLIINSLQKWVNSLNKKKFQKFIVTKFTVCHKLTFTNVFR